MHYEVERKFSILDPAALTARLAAVGAERCELEQHVDRYFNHPARDFAVTDEALRIRSKGERNFVTYKGPKIDATTKTRRELELPIGSGESNAAAFGELLGALGFVSVASVHKRRRSFAFDWRGRHFEAAIDEVDELGWFAELETTADEDALPRARELLAALTEELQLAADERRSYLQMLLERRAAGDSASRG